MPRTLPIVSALLAVVMLGACSHNGTSQKAPEAAAGDVAAINTLRDSYQTAINSGDPAKVAALYTSDAVVMNDGVPAFSGTDAIRAAMQAEFGQANEMLMLTPEETKILGGAWAMDRGQYMMHVMPKAAGGGMAMLDGKYIVLLQRQPDGSWKIAREIGNSNTPEVPAPARESAPASAAPAAPANGAPKG